MWVVTVVYLATNVEPQQELLITNCNNAQEVIDYMKEGGWDDIRRTSARVIRTEHDGASYLIARWQ